MYVFYSESFTIAFNFLATTRDPQTPPSTPQRHRDRLRHQEQDARVMHTPQHHQLPARPSDDDDPFTVNTPAQPSDGDPFVVNTPLAGGTWQLPQIPLDTPLLSLEDIQA
jgi:hypothetical protein